MKRTIQIGETGVEMLATALTPVLYKRFFREDFLVEVLKLQPKDEEDAQEKGLLASELYGKLGFIMTMQNEKPFSELPKLTETDYWEWLNRYEPTDVMKAAQDIGALWVDQSESTSKPKKEDG